MNAITTQTDSSYYCDDWAAFKQEFLRNCGITNEKEWALGKLRSIIQGQTELSAFTAEFLRLQFLASLPDDATVHEYKRALQPSILNQVWYLSPQPVTLAEWIEKARERDNVTRDARMFAYVNRQNALPQTRAPQTSQRPGNPLPPPRFNSGFYRPPQHPARDPNAMDVDGIATRVPGPRQNPVAATPNPAGHPNPPSNAFRPAQPPAILKKPASFIPTRDRVPGCYRCGKPGHFMRGCTTAVNAIEDQHVQVMDEHFAKFLEELGASEHASTSVTAAPAVPETEPVPEPEYEFNASNPGAGLYDEQDF